MQTLAAQPGILEHALPRLFEDGSVEFKAIELLLKGEARLRAENFVAAE
ncbi:hypothetical protein FACS1894116_04380 [Betaproteobacteria bacterium]|nr:hypothetical protein AGMMS49543_10100 [Betaproteobacteria bacterium]GHT93084.1 hypothetical protein FACS1894116_04380 [Betaproteobacteria bacterium]GHT97920.1 hypothetical protein FACS1894154_02360 [Betaproteobacteria bacterium]GHU02558.1 hypothetical protein AGMMS49960_15080 [Betaproteobacteria bacterium]GHU20013.1 hypothetical protein AGMMS50243_13430 [Betaproteobacteria bacterium]